MKINFPSLLNLCLIYLNIFFAISNLGKPEKWGWFVAEVLVALFLIFIRIEALRSGWWKSSDERSGI